MIADTSAHDGRNGVGKGDNPDNRTCNNRRKSTRDRLAPKRSVIGPNAKPRSSALRILDLVIPPSKGKE